jgi:hypothetical protein
LLTSGLCFPYISMFFVRPTPPDIQQRVARLKPNALPQGQTIANLVRSLPTRDFSSDRRTIGWTTGSVVEISNISNL